MNDPNWQHRGFTLVEILVAAAIFSIVVLGVVGVSRKSREISVDDLHRRQARVILDSTLESAPFDEANYAALSSVAPKNVLLDNRGTTAANDDLFATLSVFVESEKSLPAADDILVPFRDIRATIQWAESGGTESLQLTKRVTP